MPVTYLKTSGGRLWGSLLVGLALAVSPVMLSPAHAGELWVYPADVDQTTEVGDWAVAEAGGTHFTFRNVL